MWSMPTKKKVARTWQAEDRLSFPIPLLVTEKGANSRLVISVSTSSRIDG
jgi:hypothetical protein